MKRAIILSIAVLAMAMSANAATVTLLDVADTGYGSTSSTSLGSGGKYGFMNADTNNSRRMIMRWDLSSIPAGSTINSAQVNVYRSISTDATDGKLFSAYRVTSAWTEGHGMSNGGYGINPATGLPYDPDGSNWYYRDIANGIAWTSAGGDVDVLSRVQFTGATVMDPINAANFGMQPGDPTRTLSGSMAAIVQSWVNGPNYGLMIASDETSYVRHAMRTRDYGYPDDGQDRATPGTWTPQLIIDYTPAPEPATMTVLALGGLAALFRRRNR